MRLKRYFLAKTTDVYTGSGATTVAVSVGVPYSWIDLGSHGTAGTGYVVIVAEGDVTPPTAWTEAPHILDSKTPLPANVVTLLADVGVVTGDTCFTAVMKFAAIHPHFHP